MHNHLLLLYEAIWCSGASNYALFFNIFCRRRILNQVPLHAQAPCAVVAQGLQQVTPTRRTDAASGQKRRAHIGKDWIQLPIS